MRSHDDHVYVLSPTDVARIRQYLSLLHDALDRLFDRCETSLPSPASAEELMGDIDFFQRCGDPSEEANFDVMP